MPNIIEQQDLLKGLPDNRLALLLRNPDATIPPFLVAAEAQRRQAIRQQFAGDAGKESVVDSLTKQLANVPQNVQAPMQTPPRIPAPMMPQAGIAALQQAPQQAPMQAPQQMADGGIVQRYDNGGPVMLPTMIRAQPEPMWRLPEYGGVIPRVGDWVGGAARGIYDWATTPYSERRAQEETPSPMSDITTPDIRVPPARPEFAFTPGQEPAPYIDLTPKKPKPPEDTTTSPTSIENRSKAEAGRLRSELESLYATEEPSNWEEAQKWFAMSAQIMNPDANLMQGLVNAGSVYAEAEADQARERRAGERDLKEALLRFDLDELQSLRAAEAAQAERMLKLQDEASRRKFELEKAGVQAAPQFMRPYLDRVKEINEKLQEPTVNEAEKKALIEERDMYYAKIAQFEKSAGFGGIVPTRDELEAALSGQ